MYRMLLTGALLGCAATSAFAQGAMPALPDAIKPAAGQSVYLEVPATGYQVYTCGKNAAGVFAWNFKAPDAQLFDTQKKQIGKHYAGPTWEHTDGGKVLAAVKANAPAPGGNAIPWLNLEVKSSDGSGIFTQAKNILRVSTVGGTAPSAPCGEAQNGTENKVPYTATYLFVK